ncbi:MAG: hypothetical protein HFG07_01935 [Oscillibacter sp.]|nr:hypothetical protein [Oscillibacter sp.]
MDGSVQADDPGAAQRDLQLSGTPVLSETNGRLPFLSVLPMEVQSSSSTVSSVHSFNLMVTSTSKPRFTRFITGE